MLWGVGDSLYGSHLSISRNLQPFGKKTLLLLFPPSFYFFYKTFIVKTFLTKSWWLLTKITWKCIRFSLRHAVTLILELFLDLSRSRIKVFLIFVNLGWLDNKKGSQTFGKGLLVPPFTFFSVTTLLRHMVCHFSSFSS